MKKIMFAAWPWIFVFFNYGATAQDDLIKKENKKETEEIVIRKKGDKDANISIQINGDKIIVNGKPLAEFKDREITVNKRKIIVRDGNKIMLGDGPGNGSMMWDNEDGNGNMSWNNEDNESSAFLGVTTEKTEDGAKITGDVEKESAAGKAGLQKGDIITKLDDKKITGPQSLYEAVNEKKPKDEVKISYKRDGKEKSAKAVLQERKESSVRSFSFTSPDGSYKTYTIPPMPPMSKVQGWNGMDPEDFVTPEMEGQLRNIERNFNGLPQRQKLGLKIQDTEEGNGVKVLEVEDSSAAATAGLKKDDIITEIGGAKVMNTDEAREQLLENREKGKYPIKARRNGSEMNFDIKIPKKLKTANL